MAWSTEKKNRERDRAARLGELQKVLVGWWTPSMTAGVAFTGAAIAVGLIENIQLPL